MKKIIGITCLLTAFLFVCPLTGRADEDIFRPFLDDPKDYQEEDRIMTSSGSAIKKAVEQLAEQQAEDIAEWAQKAKEYGVPDLPKKVGVPEKMGSMAKKAANIRWQIGAEFIINTGPGMLGVMSSEGKDPVSFERELIHGLLSAGLSTIGGLKGGPLGAAGGAALGSEIKNWADPYWEDRDETHRLWAELTMRGDVANRSLNEAKLSCQNSENILQTNRPRIDQADQTLTKVLARTQNAVTRTDRTNGIISACMVFKSGDDREQLNQTASELNRKVGTVDSKIQDYETKITEVCQQSDKLPTEENTAAIESLFSEIEMSKDALFNEATFLKTESVALTAQVERLVNRAAAISQDAKSEISDIEEAKADAVDALKLMPPIQEIIRDMEVKIAESGQAIDKCKSHRQVVINALEGHWDKMTDNPYVGESNQTMIRRGLMEKDLDEAKGMESRINGLSIDHESFVLDVDRIKGLMGQPDKVVNFLIQRQDILKDCANLEGVDPSVQQTINTIQNIDDMKILRDANRAHECIEAYRQLASDCGQSAEKLSAAKSKADAAQSSLNSALSIPGTVHAHINSANQAAESAKQKAAAADGAIATCNALSDVYEPATAQSLAENAASEGKRLKTVADGHAAEACMRVQSAKSVSDDDARRIWHTEAGGLASFINAKAGTLDSLIKPAESEVQKLETMKSKVQTAKTGAEQNISGLSTASVSLNTAEGTLNDMDGRVAEAQGLIASARGDIASAKSLIGAAREALAGCTSASLMVDIETFNSSIPSDALIEETNSEITTASTGLANAKSAVSGAKSAVTQKMQSLQDCINFQSADSFISAAKAALSGAKADLAYIKAKEKAAIDCANQIASLTSDDSGGGDQGDDGGSGSEGEGESTEDDSYPDEENPWATVQEDRGQRQQQRESADMAAAEGRGSESESIGTQIAKTEDWLKEQERQRERQRKKKPKPRATTTRPPEKKPEQPKKPVAETPTTSPAGPQTPGGSSGGPAVKPPDTPATRPSTMSFRDATGAATIKLYFPNGEGKDYITKYRTTGGYLSTKKIPYYEISLSSKIGRCSRIIVRASVTKDWFYLVDKGSSAGPEIESSVKAGEEKTWYVEDSKGELMQIGGTTTTLFFKCN